MAQILEESENLSLERMATVRSKRGDEYLVNIDQIVCDIVDSVSDIQNESRMGWTLNPAYYQSIFPRITRHVSLCQQGGAA